MISDKKSQTKKGLVVLGLIIASGSASAGFYIDDGGSLDSQNQNSSERVYGKDTSISKSKMKKNIGQKPSSSNTMSDTHMDNDHDEVLFRGQDTSDYHVTQLGAPNISDVKVLDGFAKDVSLLIALKQVVPEGWKATKKGNINLEQKVSWGGNRPWTYVLSDLAEENNFKAQIDWDKQVVKVMQGDHVKTHKTDKTAGDLTEVVGANEARRDWEGPSLESKEIVKKKEIVESSVNNWVLDPDLTLRQNIEAWAATANWNVSWGAVDYPVVAKTVLHGEFDKEGGPLHQIVMAYRNSEQPIAIKTHAGNRVVRVTNIKYSTPSHQRGDIPSLQERR